MRFGRCEDCDKPHRPNPNRQPRDNECKCDYVPVQHKSGPSKPDIEGDFQTQRNALKWKE